MSQRQRLIDLFQFYGYRLTLGQIMKTELAREFSARISELRREGYVITCNRGKTPSENTYQMLPPPEENGQLRLI